MFHVGVAFAGGVEGLEGEADANAVIHILRKVDLGGSGRDVHDFVVLHFVVMLRKLYHNGGVVGDGGENVCQATVARAHYRALKGNI